MYRGHLWPIYINTKLGQVSSCKEGEHGKAATNEIVIALQ